jgi:hypothetical protein
MANPIEDEKQQKPEYQSPQLVTLDDLMVAEGFPPIPGGCKYGSSFMDT